MPQELNRTTNWWPPHLERFSLGDHAGPMHIACRCPIGRDHTYPEWLTLPENTDRLQRAQEVWAKGSNTDSTALRSSR